VTVESWRSQADLDAHLRTTDIATALAAADGHLAGDIAIHPLVTVPAG
jgi:quinol monooxygenase YgiN